MVTLAIVPARAGSKGLVGKNLATVGGRTLVARAVDAASHTDGVDRVVVSSDGPDILAEAARCGAEVDQRPARLASDDATIEAVVLDLLERHTDAHVIVVLQPTSPLRTSADVAACLAGLAGRDTAATVAPVPHPVEWTFRIDETGALSPVLGWDLRSRQQLPAAYQLNGAVYAARTDHLRSGGRLVERGTGAVVMPSERSIDVDTELDLEIARHLATRQSD